MKKALGIGCGGMILLLGCLIVAVIAVNLSGGHGAAGQGASTAGSAGKTTALASVRYALNQPATVKHWRIAVTQAQTRGKDLVWSEFGNKDTAAGTWYIVTVTMTNSGNENFGVNTWDFELHDGAGATYKVSDAAGAYAYSEFRGGRVSAVRCRPASR